jgi:hypothetical protein
MSTIAILIAIFFFIVLIGIFLFIKLGKKKEETFEPVEEEKTYVIEETKEGCPEEVKRKLIEEQAKLFKNAHKVYLVIKNVLEGKPIPAEIKKELQTFLRAYNRFEEMKEEIELYPFNDCEKVFKLKFEFYNNLIHSTAKKIMYLTKKIK